MGSGRFDHVTYSSTKALRSSKGIDDFEYTKQATPATPIHPNLDPARINAKPFGKLESRDSSEHPESNAVFLCFDVTGSNIDRAREAQKKLPNLMELLTKYLADPQVLIAANDDYHYVGKKCVQLSDYESDNRIDEHIRNILLTGEGGGNSGESYDLILYAAANKTVLDCFEKRGRKGYFVMYADEPIFTTTSREHARDVFGDDLPGSIPIETTIAKLKEMYHVIVLWPHKGYVNAREQYVKLFGDECVTTLQQPALICEMVASLIGMNEGKLLDEAGIASDLTAAGTAHAEAVALSKIVWATGHRKISLGGSTASA